MTDSIDSSSVEVTSRGDGDDDKLRWCEMQGEHTWLLLPNEINDDAPDYWCEVCGAYGQLKRPMSHEPPETAHLEAPATPVAGDDSFPNDDVEVDDDAIARGELSF